MGQLNFRRADNGKLLFHIWAPDWIVRVVKWFAPVPHDPKLNGTVPHDESPF